MIIATFEGFLSGVWFTTLVGVACYITGNIIPITSIINKFKK